MIRVTLQKLPDGRIQIQVAVGHIVILDRVVAINGESLTLEVRDE